MRGDLFPQASAHLTVKICQIEPIRQSPLISEIGITDRRDGAVTSAGRSAIDEECLGDKSRVQNTYWQDAPT
jgi:hypothetical protein